MKIAVPNLLALLQRATGLTLAQETVDNAARQRMKKRGMDSAAYIQAAMRDNDELAALIDLIVVPETWFFRDADAFAAASLFIRERAASVRRPVRVLSIPCASGEEPYSLAMSLLDAGMPPDNFVIEARDISREALDRAKQGIYSRNAFRGTDLAFRERHFTTMAGAYRLNPNIRSQVQFAYDNVLAMDTATGMHSYDVIFCRNLLIYFDPDTQRAAIEKLHALLRDDGLLFAGYAETPAFCQQGFAMAPYTRAFALKKKDTAISQAAPPASRAARARRNLPQLPKAPVKAGVDSSFLKQSAPTRTTDVLEQARKLADNGHLEEARSKYRAYLQVVPDSVEAYFMLGLLSEQENQKNMAVQYLRRAVYLDPNHYEALCHLALLAESSGDAAGAASFRQRAARVYQRQSGEGIEL